MLISALWFRVFAETWVSANGLTIEFVREQSDISHYIIALIANLISVYVLAWLFAKLHMDSAIRGALIGLLIGVSFFFVVNYSQNVFSFRPVILSLIEGGSIMLCWLVSGAILGAWSVYKK